MKSLAGTGALARFILRRDRVALVIWLAGVGLLPVGIAASFDELYPTADALRTLSEQSMSNPTVLGTLGPIFAPTLGGLVAWCIGAMSMLFVGIPALILVTRHTHSEEESGRRELLGATVVGRQAPLTAALVVTLGMSFAIAAAVAVGLISYGLPVVGSVALGLSFGASGWIMASVGAVTAQLTENSGSARGIGLALFAAFFALRIAGDAGGPGSSSSWLTWTSPLGWTRLTRPFADERWWVFALIGAFYVVACGLGYALSSRRNLDAGLIPDRPGPANAPAYLSRPLGLAWRLQRGAMIGWIIAFAAIGVLLGAIGPSLNEMLDTPRLSAFLSGMGADNSGDAFLYFIIYVMAQAASAYAVLAVLKMRSEETEGRANSILATATGRLRWAGSHMAFALAGPALMVLALGLATGLVLGLATGNVGEYVMSYLGIALVKVPAVWVLSGFVISLYGLLPRLSAYGGWTALILCALLELGWELGRVGQTVFGISPFAHVHPFTAEVTAATLLALILVAAGFIVVGLLGFQRRDLVG